MAQKWFVHPVTGKVLGAYDGPADKRPAYLEGAVEAEGAPEHGDQVWNGSAWTGVVPDPEPSETEVALQALVDANVLTEEQIDAAKEKVRQRGPGRRRKRK